MSPYMVASATVEDLPALVDLQFAANAGDVIFQAIYPRGATATSASHFVARLKQIVEMDLTAHIKIVKDTVLSKPVACGIWHFLPERNPEDVELDMLTSDFPFPQDANKELGIKMVQQSVRKRSEVMSQLVGMGQPYAYLETLATDPNHQRQGNASKIIEWGLERADRYDLLTYVESTPAALRLYEKHGFHRFANLRCGNPWNDEEIVNNICMIHDRASA